jgi:hypothetical protein
LPRFLVLAMFVAYVGFYVALIFWFKGIDVYHAHFLRAGKIVILHNVFRVIFIFYLFLMVHAVGTLVLRLVTSDIANVILSAIGYNFRRVLA